MPNPSIRIFPVKPEDFAQWKILWEGYAAFYGRAGDTALPDAVTNTTWARFFDPHEPLHAFVAEINGQLCGLVHCVTHRNTFTTKDVCYLEDLFVAESARGMGAGRALVEAVCQKALADGIEKVYWQTQASNTAARALYDKLATHSGFIVYARHVAIQPVS